MGNVDKRLQDRRIVALLPLDKFIVANGFYFLQFMNKLRIKILDVCVRISTIPCLWVAGSEADEMFSSSL